MPNARLLSGLPAPFGLKPQPARTAAQQEPPCGARDGVQQAIRGVVQPRMPVTHRNSAVPGAGFVFFYKMPPRRDHSDRFDAQLAEARRYLEMGKVRPRSSRSDHVVGAVIFLSCSMALAWLLSTCATRDASKTTSVALTRPDLPSPNGPGSGLASPKAQVATRSADVLAARLPKPGAPESTALEASRHRTSDASPALNKAPKAVPKAESTQTSLRFESRVATRGSRRDHETKLAATPARRTAMAHLTQAQVEARVALTRAVPSASRPSPSHQTDWTTPAASTHETAERGALLDWAARQRRANVTQRATVPVSGETDWNASMTQRRITDNPGAFQADRGQR
ncbi:hypothetical protein NDK50_35575 [Paraburkholderia bryophila]|uniref:hypothetical protein n=1 Tax=Paraburkholderia bryophila TaxID=420952 RepID=UPI002349A196|nr:hypothetical protein [Paraburkholderia bryophila]WCM23271.1 hypothetical protein NDK50_35575 [Paraburkholderia bryophila]